MPINKQFCKKYQVDPDASDHNKNRHSGKGRCDYSMHTAQLNLMVQNGKRDKQGEKKTQNRQINRQTK